MSKLKKLAPLKLVKTKSKSANKIHHPFPEKELNYLASDILKQAKNLGASAAEVSASVGHENSITVRHGNVEYIDSNRAKDLNITVYFGKKSGSASTNDLRPAAIKLTLEKACYIARYTNQDPYAGLAYAELMAFDYPDLDLYHPWSITTAKAITLAKKCETAGLDYDKHIVNSDGVSVNSSQSLGLYANSHGFIGCYPSSLHSISCTLIAKKKSQMQRDGDFTVARSPQNLISASKLGQKAAELTLRRLGARRITTRECPVIFEAPVAKTLIKHLLSAASGGNLYNKTSFLCEQLNKQILAPYIDITEHPLIPCGLGSAPFDREGVKTMTQPIVHSGILKRYLLDSYAARKLKMKSTGNAGGYYNISVTSNHTQHPAMDLNKLIKEMNRGLIVIELLGHGVNLITGDYSRGAFGLWVEHGKIQYPVEGITIAGNLKDMLRNIAVIGSDIDSRDTISSGSILIPQMKIGGK